MVEKPIETSQNLFGFSQIRAGFSTDNALIYEEILNELEEYLLRKSDDTDSTDGVFNFLALLSDQIQLEFEEVLDSNSNKKWFLRTLSKIFALLLNTKLDTIEKIKKHLKLP